MTLLLYSPHRRIEAYIILLVKHIYMKHVPQHDHYCTRKHLCVLMMHDSYVVLCIHR